MKYLTFTKTLLLSISLLTLNSCSNDNEDDLITIEDNSGENSNENDSNNDNEEMVTYKKDVKAIIDNNCVSCHSANGSSSFYLLETYDQVKASAQSGQLYSRMTDTTDPMPPSGILPGTVTQIIKNWIDDGLIEE